MDLLLKFTYVFVVRLKLAVMQNRIQFIISTYYLCPLQLSGSQYKTSVKKRLILPQGASFDLLQLNIKTYLSCLNESESSYLSGHITQLSPSFCFIIPGSMFI